MKFELKTEKENYSKSFLQFFGTLFFLTLIIILCDVALKLGIISKNHKIEYNCRLLSVEKSKPHFKKLSLLLSYSDASNKFGSLEVKKVIEKSDNFKVTAVAIAAIKCPQHIVK